MLKWRLTYPLPRSAILLFWHFSFLLSDGHLILYNEVFQMSSYCSSSIFFLLHRTRPATSQTSNPMRVGQILMKDSWISPPTLKTSHTSVATVERSLDIHYLWRYIRDPTPEKNHTPVVSVKNDSLTHQNWSNMSASTPEKNHTSVVSVKNVSLTH